MSARIKDFASLAHHWGISEADRRRIIAEKSKLLDETLERATAEVIAHIRELKAAGVDVSPKPEHSSPQQRESEREAENQGISIEDYLRNQH